jgi:sigma-E factor negative regulatory protein RseB
VTAQVLCSRLTGAAVGIVALAAGALAGEPRDWLVRMNEAVDGLNYTGTFVQLTGTDSRALQVVHRARGGERGERLLTLDGNIQEIIRGPTETRCIIPAHKVVIVDRVRDRSLWSSLPDYRGGIDSLYRIADLGREHVSGRKAQRIQVAPADDYRFGYQLWLDVATAMPLKSMTLTPDGRVVELVHFTEIDFPEQIPDAQLAATLLGEGFTTHYPKSLQPSEASPSGAASWTAGRLPPGFRLSVATREGGTTDGRPAEHLVYSDGLASVSVFIEQVMGGTRATAAFADLGASSAFSRVVGGYQIVVVGEVPADTVTLIGRSMQLRETVER